MTEANRSQEPATASPPLTADDPLVATLRQAGCVFAEDEARLLRSAARAEADLDALVARRVAGVPLEHVVGWAEFYNLRVAVRDGVFVPRRRTELIVDEAARLTPPGATVVDVCCGSGAIGAALASLREDIELHATDVDPVAVSCARVNLAPVGGKVHAGDLFEALPTRLQGHVDVVVACAPYVPTAEIVHMPPEAREHEPTVALDGGEDGLDVVRRIAARAAQWLAPGGHLLIETSSAQADDAAEDFAAHGLAPRVVDDGEATVVIGAKMAP
jgi:release factor glutamine methyltransferase